MITGDTWVWVTIIDGYIRVFEKEENAFNWVDGRSDAVIEECYVERKNEDYYQTWWEGSYDELRGIIIKKRHSSEWVKCPVDSDLKIISDRPMLQMKNGVVRRVKTVMVAGFGETSVRTFLEQRERVDRH